MSNKVLQTWDLWYPEAANTGLPFARARIDPTEVLWVHAAPPSLAVTVYDGEDVVARGEPLARAGRGLPMTRLTRRECLVEREDRWPTSEDVGAPVILPGGEVGILLGWWNAEDGTAWRWQVEFSNSR